MEKESEKMDVSGVDIKVIILCAGCGKPVGKGGAFLSFGSVCKKCFESEEIQALMRSGREGICVTKECYIRESGDR